MQQRPESSINLIYVNATHLAVPLQNHLLFSPSFQSAVIIQLPKMHRKITSFILFQFPVSMSITWFSASSSFSLVFSFSWFPADSDWLAESAGWFPFSLPWTEMGCDWLLLLPVRFPVFGFFCCDSLLGFGASYVGLGMSVLSSKIWR